MYYLYTITTWPPSEDEDELMFALKADAPKLSGPFAKPPTETKVEQYVGTHQQLLDVLPEWTAGYQVQIKIEEVKFLDPALMMEEDDGKTDY